MRRSDCVGPAFLIFDLRALTTWSTTMNCRNDRRHSEGVSKRPSLRRRAWDWKTSETNEYAAPDNTYSFVSLRPGSGISILHRPCRYLNYLTRLIPVLAAILFLHTAGLS